MKEELKSINFSKVWQVVSLFSFLFSAFYFLFSIFYDSVHNFYPPVDQNSLIFWQWTFIAKEGIELPLMTAGTIIYLLIAYFFIRNYKRLKIFKNLVFQLFSIGITLFILARTRSYIFSYFDEVWKNVTFFCLASIFLAVSLLFLNWVYKRRKLKTVAFWGIWIIFACFVILALPAPSIYDYNFFIGPALKISQGEKLGSFYMQYGVGLTYIFKLMMDLKMKVGQMQIFLAFSTMLWFGLYYILSIRLIANKYLLLLFMGFLVLFRYFAVYVDPTFIPAVSPLRIDLWVLLALCVLRFGFKSIITSGLAAALYIFDDTFGLFYLFVYLIFVCVLSIKNFNFKKLLLLLVPPAISLIWHVITFGSLISIGAKFYQSTRLAFAPISLNSPFWIILATLPYFLWLILKEENRSLRIFYLFLVSIAFSQLIYFFGRSNDNNLIHISGIFILLLFVTLNIIIKKYKISKIIILLSTISLIIAFLVFDKHINNNLRRVYTSLINLRLGNISSIEAYTDRNLNLLDGYDKYKLMIISGFDSYYNYRFGIRQLGYYVPFSIHLYIDETTNYLIDKINHGYKIVYLDQEAARLIEQLNNSKKTKTLGVQFEVIDHDNLFEVALVKSPIPITRNYQIGDIRFRFPQTWMPRKISEKKVEIQDLSKKFNMTLEILDNAEESLLDTTSYIDLKDRTPINVAGSERTLGRISRQKEGFNKFQILIFKTSGVLKIEIWPLESLDLDQFDRFVPIVNSIEFK